VMYGLKVFVFPFPKYCSDSVVSEVVVKGTTEDGEIVHKYFHAILNQFMEYGRHATLKRCRSVAQSEWNSSICEGVIWASERSLFLVF
ncbi:hypothetical protein Tco_0049635, partial [Tanacetum coccineum]